MFIGVISDTHGIIKNPNILTKVKELIKGVDVLVHLGDYTSDIKYIVDEYKGEVYAVKGNGDFGDKYPKEQIINVLGYNILICHGHSYRVNFRLNNLYYKAKELGVNAVFYGHTHVSLIEEYDGIMFLNPGSTSLPRGKSKQSMGFFEISKDGKKNVYIKNL